MNERIRELLEQADMGYLFSKDEMLPGMVNPDSMKKFAELIVGECMFAVENHGGMCGVTSSKKIKEHFGVE